MSVAGRPPILAKFSACIKVFLRRSAASPLCPLSALYADCCGLGSAHTSPVAGTKCAALSADRRRAWDIYTPSKRLRCRTRDGVRRSSHGRRFAAFRPLAAPRHALRWRGMGGCGWSLPPRPVWTRHLASCCPFASVRHRPGATSWGPMLRKLAALHWGLVIPMPHGARRVAYAPCLPERRAGQDSAFKAA